MNGVSVEVMRDKGSNGCIVRKSLVQVGQYTGVRIQVRTIDNSLMWVSEARLPVETPFYTGSVKAAVLQNPIYDLIIGNIEGAVDKECSDKATQTFAAAVTRSQAQRKLTRKPLVSVSTAELAEARELLQEQRADPTLAKVIQRFDEGSEQELHGGTQKFVLRKGRICRSRKSSSGEVAHHLVVPEKYRFGIFKLGHESAMAGHMAFGKTKDRIQVEFYWPGMDADVKRWVRSCDICQKTADKGRVKPAPLNPLPIISEPFQRVAVDIVGPINPRASDGSKYILTLVDFSTRWPEAVPLRNIETTTVAEALWEIFCRIGIPRQVLSDRGTQFTSAMMAELLRLLSIEGLRTTPYHPQCNGLCEKFNGTLKRMLRRMAAEQPKEWPRYISPLLFAYREAPQSSLKFSPFELLYGRTVRGPLQVLRELWEDDNPDPDVKATYTYVLDLTQRLRQTCELAQQELTRSQEVQKSYFDKKTKLRRLEPGTQCLLLLPTSHNKLLHQWKGPYTIVDRVNDLQYVVQVDGIQKRYHINMLKEYFRREVGAGAIVGGLHSGKVLTPEMLGCLNLVRGQFQASEQVITSAAVVIQDEEGEGPEVVNLQGTDGPTQVVLGEGLSQSGKEELGALVTSHSGIFSDRPGAAKVEAHRIEVTSSIPVRVKPYSVPLRLQGQVRDEIRSMEAAGIIERSSSSYCSPMVVVAKKDGGVRLCGDYRRLNSITKVDAEPMSDCRSIFARLAGSRWFSKLDLTKGFFQIPLDAESRKLTAFATPEGLFQYTVLPFGLNNSPAVFNRMMRQVLRGIPQVEVFMDDVLIHTASFAEHLQILDQVFARLEEYHLTVKPSKCELARSRVDYLGHSVGEGGCSCQGAKVRQIRDAPRPTTKKQVRSFLGLAGYYSQFIPQYAAIALPLYELLKKHAPNKVNWGREQEAAFKELKSHLTKDPILQLADFSKSFILRTDASQSAVGAVLLQEKDGEVFPIAYHSRTLKGAELRYSTVEKELVGVIEGVKKFYFYLYGAPFIIETDHLPLTSLQTSKNANQRLMRWAMYLQQFTFTVRYIKGRDNVGADWLSRMVEEEPRGNSE